MAGRYLMRASGEGMPAFTKTFHSFRKALKEATGYARMYGLAVVRDGQAEPARGTLAHCVYQRKPRRGPHSPHYAASAQFARCSISSEGKKILSKNKKRSRR
jgi:hypothetical protein